MFHIFFSFSGFNIAGKLHPLHEVYLSHLGKYCKPSVLLSHAKAHNDVIFLAVETKIINDYDSSLTYIFHSSIRND